MKDQGITPWDQLRRYSFLSFHGHLARLPASRLALLALDWRGLEWWRSRQSLIVGTGRHSLRHVGRGIVACALELPLERCFKQFCKTEEYNEACIRALQQGELPPCDWKTLASCRITWRWFSRVYSFGKAGVRRWNDRQG